MRMIISLDVAGDSGDNEELRRLATAVLTGDATPDDETDFLAAVNSVDEIEFPEFVPPVSPFQVLPDAS